MREKRPISPSHFFQAFQVFRHEEFVAACYPSGDVSGRASERALAHHLRSGHLVRIRRGLYAVVGRGRGPSGGGEAPSSFLIASKVAPDAVLAYHTALEYLGCAYSLRNDRIVLTSSKTKGFEHGGISYRVAAYPRALDTPEKRLFGVESREERGATVRVTGLERTLVDLLDRPETAGGWEELWRSFEGAGFVDPKRIVQHVCNLASRTTAARVGWFLEEHRERWMIPDTIFATLESMAPRSPVYLLRSRRESGVLIPRWNLVVPRQVAARQWGEVL